MRKAFGYYVAVIIFIFSFSAPVSPIFAANDQCSTFAINGKDAKSGPVQIDTNTTILEIKIGGQLRPGDNYNLYIDGSRPGSNKDSDTNATVDNNFLLTYLIDKTQRTINGNTIFITPMDKIFNATTHSVAIYTTGGFFGEAKEFCSFPNAYTIIPVAVNPNTPGVVNANCDIHFGTPPNFDHIPIYQPGESINIYGKLPTYDKNRVLLQILDPTGKEMLSQCTDFNTTNQTFYSDLSGQTGQKGYWFLNVYRAKETIFGVKTFCNRESDLTFCPSVSFQVTTQTPLPTAAPGEVILTPTVPPAPSPPCSEWVAELSGTPMPIPVEPTQAAAIWQDSKIIKKCASVSTGLGINVSTDAGALVKSVFGIILSISGGIALILIIISGYQLIFSQGNPEAVKAAQERLTSAVVGLLFIIFSLVILQIIGANILQIPGFTK